LGVLRGVFVKKRKEEMKRMESYESGGLWEV